MLVNSSAYAWFEGCDRITVSCDSKWARVMSRPSSISSFHQFNTWHGMTYAINRFEFERTSENFAILFSNEKSCEINQINSVSYVALLACGLATRMWSAETGRNQQTPLFSTRRSAKTPWEKIMGPMSVDFSIFTFYKTACNNLSTCSGEGIHWLI